MTKYILKGHEPVQVFDILEWARWFETADRKVDRTELPDNVVVSTVFLGLNHNLGTKGLPILFETLVFGGPLDGEMIRSATWKDAIAEHEAMVKRVLEREPPADAGSG